MDESRISVRYAKALFETAIEKGLLEQTEQDMKLLLEVGMQPDFRYFTDDPSIPPAKKTEFFIEVFGEHVGQLTIDIASLVIRNGRERYLAGIARNYIALSRKQQGITTVVLTTATEPGAKTKEMIRAEIEETLKSEIDMKEVVDPAIIGGFVLQIGDRLFDASVKEKLKKIRKEISN